MVILIGYSILLVNFTCGSVFKTYFVHICGCDDSLSSSVSRSSLQKLTHRLLDFWRPPRGVRLRRGDGKERGRGSSEDWPPSLGWPRPTSSESRSVWNWYKTTAP